MRKETATKIEKEEKGKNLWGRRLAAVRRRHDRAGRSERSATMTFRALQEQMKWEKGAQASRTRQPGRVKDPAFPRKKSRGKGKAQSHSLKGKKREEGHRCDG